MLNGKINLKEMIWAINKQNKVARPDGLPTELYKTQQDILGNRLLKLFNEVLDEAKIPQSWKGAMITIIPKEKNDRTNIGNYTPIFLLNVDYKIFVTIIAERFKNIKFIHTDQNGFLPYRHLRNNIRTILDVIEYYEKHNGDQVALLFGC
uniref:Reverse transcriptase domain-containing protein n=1 Tax=Micrurus lemniscatus lemniscatus TaxID=129467 RepID=A0A2D4IT20_MICLE